MHKKPHETPLKVNNLSKKKNIKSAKSGKKSEKSDFLLEMVSNALGTPRNTFKSQKLVKKPIKSGKVGLG